GDRIHLYGFAPAGAALQLNRALRASPSRGGAVLRFNPAGDRLATRGWANIVHLFDVHTGRLVFSTHALLSTAEPTLYFHLSGGRLAACHFGAQEERIGLWSVADGREYRALVHDGPGRKHNFAYLPAIHPGGRLAAEGFEDGLALFDLETGRELAFVKVAQGV